MKEKRDIFDHIKNERQALKVITFIAFFIWQSIPAVLGVAIYVIFIRLVRLRWFQVLGVGVLLAGVGILLHMHQYNDLPDAIAQGFWCNIYFWKALFSGGFGSAAYYIGQEAINYVLLLPILIGGLLGLIDLIPISAHEKELQAIQGAQLTKKKDLPAAKIQKALNNLQDRNFKGTLLGVSKYSGLPVVLPDNFVNQIVLVLGTTGGGKTVTLRRFYKRAAMRGYPLIIVDGKPTDESIEWVSNLAKKHDRKFYGFNCGNFYHYDPLAQGSYTELKDKIISLKDQWESDYYRSIAEDYLQTTFEVLIKSKTPYDLQRVVKYLDYSALSTLTRAMDDKNLSPRVERLEGYDRKDITGLQAHLSLLIHSELGEFFEITENNTFSLPKVLDENAIVYFALPALRYPSFSKVLGKLVINDLKAVIDRNTGGKKVFTIFDEFSVFAGEQVLNLVNMGRSKGVHAVFGTQGLADLKKVDKNFAGQVLNCANTIICHRINDQESAEDIGLWVGTQEAFNLTAQVNAEVSGSGAGLGSIRRVKEFIVHPDSIKQDLPVGEAFLISKVGGFRMDKLKVKFN